jgi:hypothetical protein
VVAGLSDLAPRPPACCAPPPRAPATSALSPTGGSPLSRMLLASFCEPAAPTHPAAHGRFVSLMLANDTRPPPPRDACAGSAGRRTAGRGAAPVAAAAVRRPEQESRWSRTW